MNSVSGLTILQEQNENILRQGKVKEFVASRATLTDQLRKVPQTERK